MNDRRPLSQTLTDLIAYAETLSTRPRHVAPGGIGGNIGAMAAAIRDADLRPAEGVRTTRAGMCMVNAIESYHASEGYAGMAWLMVVGTVLPLLRQDAWQAMMNEREAKS